MVSDSPKTPQQLLPVAPYRGTRDFLPDEMSVRQQVFQTLYRVIETFGYQRYDGPLLEPVEIYEAKSSQEIVNEQLYTLTDRGDRRLALRPEMTPSVARMVAANLGRLPFPLRWYSHVNCFRYERPQRGRVREHWQINVDVFGSESYEAEAEIFAMIHSMMRALGAGPENYVLRVSDRALVERALVARAALSQEQVRPVFRLLDRWEKQTLEENRAALAEAGLTEAQCDGVAEVIHLDLEGIAALAGEEAVAASNVVRVLREGVSGGPTVFDPLIIRGFDYYTSTVFEVFDTSPDNRRSLFGGGRYDNLVGLFKSQKVSGLGFGMGDVTLINFLETHGLAPAPDLAPDVAVLFQGEELAAPARHVAAALREGGLKVIFPLERRALGKEMKAVGKLGARLVVILHEEEWARGAVVLRNMETSSQEEVSVESVDAAARAALGG